MTSRALIRDLYANALTVLNNNQNIIPVRNLQNIKIATIAINRNDISVVSEKNCMIIILPIISSLILQIQQHVISC